MWATITAASSTRWSPATQIVPMRRCASILKSAMNTEGAPSPAKSTAGRRADGKSTSSKKKSVAMGREGKGSVGFIGIGTMGREMVLNLLKAGHPVRAFDLNEAALADIAKEGAARAA